MRTFHTQLTNYATIYNHSQFVPVVVWTYSGHNETLHFAWLVIQTKQSRTLSSPGQTMSLLYSLRIESRFAKFQPHASLDTWTSGLGTSYGQPFQLNRWPRQFIFCLNKLRSFWQRIRRQTVSVLPCCPTSTRTSAPALFYHHVWTISLAFNLEFLFLAS